MASRVSRRKRIIVLVIVLAILAIPVALIAMRPPIGAYLCPACYGFEQIGPKVYAEDGSPPAYREKLLETLARADKRLNRTFPERVARPPVFLVCRTDECLKRLHGGSAKAVAYGSTFVFVHPIGLTTTFIAHELSHIEFHAREGSFALLSDRVPAWFDEGLAVVASRDERYLKLTNGKVECRVPARNDLPVSARQWRLEAGKGQRQNYASAGCRVLHWLDRHAHDGGVVRLAAQVRAGQSFYE